MDDIDNEKGVIRILEILMMQLGYSHAKKEIEYERNMKVGRDKRIRADIVVNLKVKTEDNKYKPFLVIEAKRPDITDLKEALTQGMSYALQLRAKLLLVTNGDKFELFDVDTNEIIYKNSLYEKNLVFLNKTNMCNYFNTNPRPLTLPSYEFDNSWFEFIDYNDMISKYNNRIRELLDDNEVLKAQINYLNQSINTISKKNLLAETSELKYYIEADKKNLKDLKTKNSLIEALTTELNMYKFSRNNVTNKFENEISLLNRKLIDKENEIFMLNNNISELAIKVDKSLADIALYKITMKDKNNLINNLTIEVNSYKTSRNDVINKLENQISCLKNEQIEKDNQLTTINYENKKLTAELEESFHNIKSYTDDLSYFQAQVEISKGVIKDKNLELKEKEKALKEINLMSSNSIATHKKTIHDLIDKSNNLLRIRNILYYVIVILLLLNLSLLYKK